MPRRRLHPKGSTSTDRMAVSRALLKKKEGRIKTFRLGVKSLKALARIMRRPEARGTEAALIEWLLVEFDHVLAVDVRQAAGRRAVQHFVKGQRRTNAERRQRWTLDASQAAAPRRRLGWLRAPL